jgi:hypothetical protein
MCFRLRRAKGHFTHNVTKPEPYPFDGGGSRSLTLIPLKFKKEPGQAVLNFNTLNYKKNSHFSFTSCIKMSWRSAKDLTVYNVPQLPQHLKLSTHAYSRPKSSVYDPCFA